MTYSTTHPYRVRDLIAALTEHDPDLPVDVHCNLPGEHDWDECNCECGDRVLPLRLVTRPTRNSMDVTLILSAADRVDAGNIFRATAAHAPAAGDTTTVAPGNHPITARDDRLATAEVPGRASPFPDGREGPGATQNADAGPASRAHIEAGVVAALGLRDAVIDGMKPPSPGSPYQFWLGAQWAYEQVRAALTDWQEVAE